MKALLSKLFNSAPDEPAQIVHTEPPPLQGADMAIAFFSPQAGGDVHAFLRVSPTRFLFGMLDVAGKRETSVPILEAAHSCFLKSGEQIFSQPELNEPEAMIELSRRFNLEIMRAAGGVRSCPAFAACYNEELGTVCYVNAGHTPGLLSDDSGTVELAATGLPLGLFSLAPTDARVVGMGSQSSIAVVSRGVVEAENKRSEFGLDGVKTAMQTKGASAKDLSQRILEDVQTFMQSAPKHNDVMALVLTRAA